MLTSILFVSAVFLQVSPELATALEAAEAEKPVAVSSKVGREAVRQLVDSRSVSGKRLKALITIALEGRAKAPLGQALVQVAVKQRNLATAGIAVQTLASLDRKLRLRVLRSTPKGWSERLLRLARSEDSATAKASVVLLAPNLEADALRRLLQRWIADERADLTIALLAQARDFPDALAAFRVLARLEVSSAVEVALGDALANLVERDAEVAAKAVQEASRGSSAVVRSLGALLERQQVRDASRLLSSLIDPDDLGQERVVAAALRSAAELLVTDVEPAARALAAQRSAPATVRRAAVWALSRLAYKDQPTIELFVRLLGDRAVASAAHEALTFKTGAKLRGKTDAWRQWLYTAKLPAQTPDDLQERHAKARELRLRFARSKIRAARRAAAKRQQRATKAKASQ